ncbi:MAG: 3-oxoacyl-ACP reductase FabG [Hallerella sp.]|jgi:3-oxoacyl-[acyl-carrier protein] reductase|nr:3-oxoacyl-ACP reductase FabG [Fibrobacter sp.]MDY6369103.1 3-oxoacyl-ACP reductase FabG [Fibrobacter sp.]MDY6390818.1 3-oxoacyl-ACP reductase FabG [Fibrobacter sp.]MEE3339284.1 3-oxoacyl-ACP reductase FabG [Hallerella sp.]
MDEVKRVLVTGASGGIGLAIVKAVLAAGYHVVAHYNSHAESLVELQKEFGDKIQLIQFNVADRENCKTILENDVKENGAYFGVVLSSGICRDAAFPAMTDEYWDKVLDVNLNGFYNVLHPIVMPMCRKRKGRIVTIASVSGVIGNRGQVNYSASKGGIIAASKALAVELASRNITVNSIAPGVIETEMIKDAPVDMILPAIPMHRVGKPEEVAATVVFLLSEGAGYITRQVISVNGGLA